MADKMTTMPKPNDVHTRARITTARAVQGYCSQENCPRPKTLNSLSTAPPGRKMLLKRTPTMTGESTMGMKKRKRKTRQPRTFSYTSTAVTKDAARIRGTEMRKIKELTSTWVMMGLEKMRRKFSRPMKVLVAPSQLVKL